MESEKKNEECKFHSYKTSNYKKINNVTRQKLIEMVYLQDYLLKDAAKQLKMNYSTAKTILRIFRTEKRIEKKNALDEKELKTIINKYKNDKSSKLFQVVYKENSIGLESPTLSKVSIEEKSDSKILENNNLKINDEVPQTLNKNLKNFFGNFMEIFSNIDNCFKQLKNNQHEFNSLVTNTFEANIKMMITTNNRKNIIFNFRYYGVC